MVPMALGFVVRDLRPGDLRERGGSRDAPAAGDPAEQAADPHAQMPLLERLARPLRIRRPDALAALLAQRLGPQPLLLRGPGLLAGLRARLRLRRLGHGRGALVRPNQTFRLPNGMNDEVVSSCLFITRRDP